MKLSDKLIELRKEKGWSQEDFAEKLDVSRQAISRWENGSALPDAQNLFRISKLFNVSADYLLNDGHEGEKTIPATDAATEVTAPPIQKKNFPYWFLIPIACFIVLAACIVINAVECSHTYHTLSSVKENEIAPSCTSEGSYDEVIYCTKCNEELVRTTQRVAKLPHTLASSVKENEVAPSCTSEGSYDEVIYCTDCNAELMRTTQSVAKLAHTLSNSVKENEIAPSCTSEGSYDEVIYCTDCNAELMRITQSVAKLPHTLASSVKENEVAPSCTSEGSYDEVVYCKKCKGEILRTKRKEEKLAHQYQNKKCTACGEAQPSEGLLYMSNGNGTCTVDIGDCADENIVIPSHSPSGEKVVQIKAYAFRGRNNIKSVQIPETVTTIGEGAFQDCFNLESVNLPKKITMIYPYTFFGCINLKEITIPSGVTYIGVEAFADCYAFESIVIPASVTKIGQYAFRNFSKCEGTVIFEIYDGWVLYNDSDDPVDIVDFKNSHFTPCERITWIYSEYFWKRG